MNDDPNLYQYAGEDHLRHENKDLKERVDALEHRLESVEKLNTKLEARLYRVYARIFGADTGKDG